MIRTLAIAALAACLSTAARADMVDDCVQDGDIKRQIQGCTAVIDSGQWQGPDLAWAYNNLGNAMRDLAWYPEALDAYETAIWLDPESAAAYNNRGWTAYLAGGDLEQALADADWSLQLRPDDVHTLDTRAHVLAALGQIKAAMVAFEQAAAAGGVDRVTMYEDALAGHGYDAGPADGSYDETTRQALLACLMAGCRLVR